MSFPICSPAEASPPTSSTNISFKAVPVFASSSWIFLSLSPEMRFMAVCSPIVEALLARFSKGPSMDAERSFIALSYVSLYFSSSFFAVFSASAIFSSILIRKASVSLSAWASASFSFCSYASFACFSFSSVIIPREMIVAVAAGPISRSFSMKESFRIFFSSSFSS